MISTILILGGGQAGAEAADTLRREGYAGRLVLVSDEPQLPYRSRMASRSHTTGRCSASARSRGN
jgi:3-phenylpropionate/trans-cinnamate dioxygenase ferredoxin reductase subunit